MKKSIFALFIVGMFLFSSVGCFAQPGGDTHSQIVYTEVIKNISGSELITHVTTDRISPYVTKVIGFEVLMLETTPVWGTLWDGTANTVVEEVVSEVEATPYGAGIMFFPFPRYLTTQATVCQSNNSQTIIYYIKN